MLESASVFATSAKASAREVTVLKSDLLAANRQVRSFFDCRERLVDSGTESRPPADHHRTITTPLADRGGLSIIDAEIIKKSDR
jgi:hypothetical protein